MIWRIELQRRKRRFCSRGETKIQRKEEEAGRREDNTTRMFFFWLLFPLATSSQTVLVSCYKIFFVKYQMHSELQSLIQIQILSIQFTFKKKSMIHFFFSRLHILTLPPISLYFLSHSVSHSTTVHQWSTSHLVVFHLPLYLHMLN